MRFVLVSNQVSPQKEEPTEQEARKIIAQGKSVHENGGGICDCPYQQFFDTRYKYWITGFAIASFEEKNGVDFNSFDDDEKVSMIVDSGFWRHGDIFSFEPYHDKLLAAIKEQEAAEDREEEEEAEGMASYEGSRYYGVSGEEVWKEYREFHFFTSNDTEYLDDCPPGGIYEELEEMFSDLKDKLEIGSCESSHTFVADDSDDYNAISQRIHKTLQENGWVHNPKFDWDEP